MIKIINQLILKVFFISIFFSSCNNANTDEIKNHDNLFISSITPTNGSSVGKSPTISISFSDDLDSTTVDNSTIKITPEYCSKQNTYY